MDSGDKLVRTIGKLAVKDRKHYLKQARKGNLPIAAESARAVEDAWRYIFEYLLHTASAEETIELILQDFDKAFPQDWETSESLPDIIEDGKHIPVTADLYLRATTDTSKPARKLKLLVAGFAALSAAQLASIYAFSGNNKAAGSSWYDENPLFDEYPPTEELKQFIGT